MVGFEEKEVMAMVIETAIEGLGRAIRVCETIARRDIETMRAIGDDGDTIVIQGAEVIKALISIRRRYVR